MSFYRNSLKESLQERLAYFNQAGMSKEASLLQARLNSFAEEEPQNIAVAVQKNEAESPIVKTVIENLKTKLSTRIPELERQYILENASKAKTLKDLEHLRVAYIERMLKISRAARSEKIEFIGSEKEAAGPYNNEKTFFEALQVIYSQDPLWIEDFKELYL